MITNFGSINIDHVYQVTNLPKAGETLSAKSYARYLGGKGVNQSVAIAKAGGTLRHVGAVGADGDWALAQMANNGVGDDHVARLDIATGHAIIYVDDSAENQIVILGGANTALTEQIVDDALVDAMGWVLFQNETNMIDVIAAKSADAGCKLAYAAAPFSKEHALPLLDKIDLLAVNETEANDLADATGRKVEDLGVPILLVTKGSAGADLWVDGKYFHQTAFKVDAVDTTGAGDTFLGSFLAQYDETNDPARALQYATAASAIQVTRQGAANAIPDKKDVIKFLEAQVK
ncbi:ribokinase [Amylibacter ulvae]|uniref:Ribokinase n=1 Tax=Paramylibacter ulvae TaxID=1651968 RepID=A0ABQ3CUQ7_9RHOB|nr:ribokinase [Amylibacter ulvae]GHA44792.1 ribokinase [Amylibacter ulvae]